MDTASPSRSGTPLPAYNPHQNSSTERPPPFYEEFEAYDGMGTVFFVIGFCEHFASHFVN